MRQTEANGLWKLISGLRRRRATEVDTSGRLRVNRTFVFVDPFVKLPSRSAVCGVRLETTLALEFFAYRGKFYLKEKAFEIVYSGV